MEESNFKVTNRIGYNVKHNFNNDFVELLGDLFKKYGEEVFKIHGINSTDLDMTKFPKSFYSKSGSVAKLSIDANANVSAKDVSQYNYERFKSEGKLNSIYMLYKWVKKCFSKKDAKIAVERIISGDIFLNDLVNVEIPYCYSFDLNKLLLDGMDFFDGKNIIIKPPSRSDSFIAQVIQTTAFISNQIMGAVAYPSFFVILDKFYRQEYGEDYTNRLKDGNNLELPEELSEKHFIEQNKELLEKLKLSEESHLNILLENRRYFELAKTYYLDSNKANIWSRIKNQFQNIVFSLNFPFRGNQSSFSNLSVMDKGFSEALFKDYVFLDDGTSPNLDSSIELSKKFYEVFDSMQCTEGIFTFPVMTLAVSLNENREYLDENFVDWLSEVNCKKSFGNVFQSLPTSYSSCCRLKNDLTKIGGMGFQNSFGVSGLSIGSHRVAGINLPRLAILEKDNPNQLYEILDTLHKLLYSHRMLMKERIDKGVMPLYTKGWMSLTRQYSTIGLLGGFQYCKNKGMSILEQEGIDSLRDTMLKIEVEIVKWQEEEASLNHVYNIEGVPGESQCVKLCEIDKKLGYCSKETKLYSNQYIDLMEDCSIHDRMKIHGNFDSITSGGNILHITYKDSKPLTKEQYKSIVKNAKDAKVEYFAVNYTYSNCKKGHKTIGEKDNCDICGEEISDKYSRVVGFVTPVSAWNSVREGYEYKRRKSPKIENS